MSTEVEITDLASVQIRTEADIVVCRQQARHLAAAIGFDTQTQVRIATSVSEIARNAFQYAGGGKAAFRVETDASGRLRHNLRQQSLLIEITDQGAGIENLSVVLGGSYKSTTGLGLGILGARRLMDQVDIETSPAGSTIILRKNLPPNITRKTPQELSALASTQASGAPQPASVIAEVQQQNRELLGVMEEIQSRQEDLVRMNKELEETNAGVLALYDELDTLHRVGLLLASKMDLPAVMHALIVATTELTNAQISTCYLRSKDSAEWERYADAGSRAEVLQSLQKMQTDDFFGQGFARESMINVPDLAQEDDTKNCMVQFAAALAPNFVLRSCLAVPLKDADGMLLGVLIFGSESPGLFSERSERIVSSISAQATIAIENARLFDSVKAASEAKDKFLAMISHELRTPLNPVLSIISGLHENPALPEVFREDIAVVLRNIQLETRLIDDLLDFHRIIKGNLNFAAEPVDMHAMIRNVVDICRMEVEQRGHQLKVSLAAEKCIVAGDPARLQQVLWNILKNAIKFTAPGGEICINTSVEFGDTLLITAVDNGRGIEAEMLGSIFSAFEQGSVQGLTHFGGLGLGLAIVKSFVQKHGGSVDAESLGRDMGATFSIRLPLIDTTVLREESAAKSAAAGGAPQAVHTGRILLIDDHADTLWSLNRLLMRRGYEVTTASSCAEALKLVQQGEFDVIISDLGLPDGSGIDLIRDMRKHSAAPAIALSGYGMESDMSQTRAAGFVTHLTKPVDFPALVEALRELMKATP